MPTDYFENFLDKNEVREESQFPSWVTPKNSSLKAFTAMIGLEKEKKEYIRRHSRKPHFSKKSDYLIQRARLVVPLESLLSRCSIASPIRQISRNTLSKSIKN